MDETQAPGGLKTDIAYAMITLGGTAMWSILGGWLLYFYVPPEGHGSILVPAALYGAVVFIARATHLIVNPLIGYWSDHMRSRWGRRLPFMFLASLPILVLFVLLWTPPVHAQSGWNVVYLCTILILYNLALGLHQIPYNALLPELAVAERHRVRMSAWYAAFQLLGIILASFAGVLIDNQGYEVMALAYGGLCIPLLFLPFFVLRERPGRQIAASERLRFWQSLAVTSRNRPFQVFVVTSALYWIAMAFTQAAIPFIVTEICLATEAQALYFYLAAVLGALLCFPLVTRLAARLGKWRVLAGSLLLSAGVLPLLLLIGEQWPVPLLAQGIIWVALQAVAMSGVTVLPPAFTAEITDYDAVLTGQRREGSYYAAWTVLDHIVNGVAAAALPLLLLLGRSHSDPHGPLGVRLVGVVGGACLLLAFAALMRYPLRDASWRARQVTAVDREVAMEAGHGV